MRLHVVPASLGAAGSGRHQGRHAGRSELVSAGGRHFCRQRAALGSHEPGRSEIPDLSAWTGLRAHLLMLVRIGLAAGASLSLFLGWLASPAYGADPVWPSTHWATVDDPATLGWSSE